MKPQKPQKIYETEQDILDAIDAAKKRARNADEQSEEFEKMRKSAIKSASEAIEHESADAEYWRDQAQEFKIKAEKSRTTSRRINEITLKNLKEAMAAFKTETMYFMANDNSVSR